MLAPMQTIYSLVAVAKRDCPGGRLIAPPLHETAEHGESLKVFSRDDAAFPEQLSATTPR
jgi:hypothetical protein